MIQRILVFFVALAAMTSCMAPQRGTSGATQQQTSNTQSLLGSLLSGLIGSNTQVTEKMLQGSWTYSSPECRFESEDDLAKAGGVVAANTVEKKLAEVYGKLGISPNSCNFTFNADKTCSITLGGRTVNGTYSLNPSTRALSIVSNTGLIKLNGTVYYDLSTLTILFDAQKLLNMAQMLAAFTGQNNSTIGAMSSLLGQYQGMMVGMNLRK